MVAISRLYAAVIARGWNTALSMLLPFRETS